MCITGSSANPESQSGEDGAELSYKYYLIKIKQLKIIDFSQNS